MASASQECEICSESYDTAEHKPIVLLCGHSFCRSCLLALELQGDMKCPNCRQPVTSPVDQLPVNYALIPSEETRGPSKSNSEMFERCQAHGFDLDIFCASCGVLICMKCVVKSHHQHYIVEEKDLLNEIQPDTDFLLNLKSKMTMSKGYLNKTLSEVEKVRDTFKPLEQCGKDVQHCLDTLEYMSTVDSKEVTGWKNAHSMSKAEKRELFKTLPGRWQNETKKLCQDLISGIIESNMKKIQETSKVLQELASEQPRASSLGAAEERGLLPSNSHWKLSTNEDVQRALTSVEDGRRASSLKIVSSATEPIRELPKVLNTLCTACIGDIQIIDMNSFWGASQKSLHSVIGKHSRSIIEFYGSFTDASALVRTKGKSAMKLGVGITSSNEIHQLQDWDVKPSSLSFNDALTLEHIIKQPQSLDLSCIHFPDLSGEEDLVKTFLKNYFGKPLWFAKSLYLPRCNLSEASMFDLLNNCEGFLKIFCQHNSLSTEIRERLTTSAQEKNIRLFWDIRGANL